jgi:acyl dehydratase
MVDAFATLTRDTYFIHTDPERAAKETPFGGTIAHGFLTLSLMSCMAYQVCPAIEGTQTGVNYGMNRLRFVAPVRTGKRVRGHFVLKHFEVKDRRWQSTMDVSVEIEGEAKPALVAEWVTAGLL